MVCESVEESSSDMEHFLFSGTTASKSYSSKRIVFLQRAHTVQRQYRQERRPRCRYGLKRRAEKRRRNEEKGRRTRQQRLKR